MTAPPPCSLPAWLGLARPGNPLHRVVAPACHLIQPNAEVLGPIPPLPYTQPPCRYSGRCAWLASFTSHIDPSARALSAKLLGVACEGLPAGEAEQQLAALVGAFAAKRYEEAEGAVLAAGGWPLEWAVAVAGCGRRSWQRQRLVAGVLCSLRVAAGWSLPSQALLAQGCTGCCWRRAHVPGRLAESRQERKSREPCPGPSTPQASCWRRR